MTNTLLAQEPAIRLGAFAGVFLLMALLETLAPRRPLASPRHLRWTGNLAIVALDTLAVRLAFPLLAVGMALLAQQRGWGLFNLVALPAPLAILACVLLLDLAIYAQHRLFHRVPLFWRLHRMHHADTDLDVTTALRFHPLEIILSMLLKLALVALLGAPALAVLLFEVLLNATAMFNHANLRLPPALDRFLRPLIVTPDMHRVHHSSAPAETDSNYGFNLSLWDHLFKSYRAQPALGHEGMTIGLTIFRTPQDQRLDRLLLQPFRQPPSQDQG